MFSAKKFVWVVKCDTEEKGEQKVKKTLVLILSLAMTLSILAGCSSSPKSTVNTSSSVSSSTSSSAAKVALKWQSYDSLDKYKTIISAYQSEHSSVTIQFEQVSDYTTKLLTEASSGDLPDLINTNTGTTQVLGDAGVLKAIDINNVKADPAYNFSDIWGTAAAYCTYNGTWYSLPLDGGNYAWVYNKLMFDKCGIKVPGGGFTWDQFESACKTLLANKAKLGIKYPTIFNDLSSSIDMMYPLIAQAGGSYLNADGTSAWNSAAAVTAFNWVKRLVAAGYIPPIEKLGDGYDALITKFNAGDIAMCRVALWNSLYLKDSSKVQWVAMDSPKGNDGKQAEVLFLNGIGISSTSKNADQALDFIKYVTGPKGMEIYLKGCSSPQIAVRRSQSALSVAMFDKSKNMQVFNTSLAYGGYVNLTKTFSDQQDTINQYFDKIWYKKADVPSTLNQMAETLNTKLK